MPRDRSTPRAGREEGAHLVEVAGHAERRQRAQEGVAVAPRRQARVEDAEDAAVAARADEASRPLLERQHGVRHLEVRADSELLIKQLRGEYKVRSEGLKPLYQRALELLGKFEGAKLVHVRRELNAEADRLANRGINEAKRAAKAGEPGPGGA